MAVPVFSVFLHLRTSISDAVQMPRNFTENFYGPEGTQRALAAPRGCPEGGTTHQGAPGGPGAPWWVVPTSGAPRTVGERSNFKKIPTHTQDHGDA